MESIACLSASGNIAVQISAVGLVLTAKSIARYDRISKDQEFAEYYLLGTLLSTICAVAAAAI